MRGKVSLYFVQVYKHGITPAYAGKSDFLPMNSVSGTGSPPPMRGKGIIFSVLRKKDRITPAYAGKSFSGWRRDRR